MTTKEYLGQVSVLERRIRAKKDEIERFHELTCSPSIKMDGEKVCSSGSNDPMADAVVKIIEMEKELHDMLTKYLEIRKIISNKVVSMTTPLYSDILYDKYIVGIPFGKMEGIIGYSKRQIIHYHGFALLEFEQLYKEQYKDYISPLQS